MLLLKGNVRNTVSWKKNIVCRSQIPYSNVGQATYLNKTPCMYYCPVNKWRNSIFVLLLLQTLTVNECPCLHHTCMLQGLSYSCIPQLKELWLKPVLSERLLPNSIRRFIIAGLSRSTHTLTTHSYPAGSWIRYVTMWNTTPFKDVFLHFK